MAPSPCNLKQNGGLVKVRVKNNKSITKKNKDFNILHNAVHFCFNEIAKQNKWSAKDASKALGEYFSVLEKTKNKSDTKIAKQGGSGETVYPTLMKYVEWMRRGMGWGVSVMVGTFDTTCNTIISLIAIGTWCVVIYNMVNNVSPDEARRSLAQPVQYVIYNKAPELYTMEEDITQHMIDYVETNVYSHYQELHKVIEHKTIINAIRTLFWESKLYNLFIVKPIACLLIPIIPSCSKTCIKRNSVKSTKRKSASAKRSSAKRSSAKRSSTKRSSTKRKSASVKRSSTKRSSTSTSTGSKRKSASASTGTKRRSSRYYTPKEE
jgi:hypothetical protein